ncbi:MAG: hypothetical protein P8Y10_13355 [Gemmatimonadales bacterium]|jgi:hypothetical protein
MRVADRWVSSWLLAGLALAGPLRAQPTPSNVATVVAPESFQEIRGAILGQVRSGDVPR